MTDTELNAVVTEIVALLRDTGYADRAAWMETRLATLERTDATVDDVEHAKGELNAIILGMGGLMDLNLQPSPALRLSAAAAREALDRLADRLYELTRSGQRHFQ